MPEVCGRLAGWDLWTPKACRARQGGTENLPEPTPQAHLERGKDENHSCTQRTSPLSRNSTNHWKRRNTTSRHDPQRFRTACQTPLNGLGSSHGGSEG